MVERMELKNKIDWITTSPLTMDKWDNLITVLKENKMEELIKDLYKNKDNYDNMLLSIKTITQLWRDKNQLSDCWITN